MKKIINRSLSLFLAVICVFGVCALSAGAANSGSCGKNVRWSFDGISKTLTISGSGDMTSYNTYYATDENFSSFSGNGDAPWHGFASSIRYLEIKSGVTSIGNYAFSGLSTITSVTLPRGLKTVGSFAFSSCSSLESIYFPKSLTWIDGNAFRGCTGLKDVYVEDYENKTEIGIYPAGNDCLFDAKWHFHSSGIPGFSIPSHGGGTEVDPDATSVSYGSNVIFNFDLTSLNLPSSYTLVLCEGNTVENIIARGDSAKIYHTVKKLTSDKTFLFTVIDENGRQISRYNNKSLSYDIKIHVTTGFFDKLIAFFLGIFGLAPECELSMVI